MYSFASSSGKLAWRIHTGGYVYGSAAVAQVPGGQPTVYFGSYDRRFYALDARSGAKSWVADAHGRVSGGAVVIGDTVWFSTLEQQTGLWAPNRHTCCLKISRGQFNPVVSDGQRLYLARRAMLSRDPQRAGSTKLNKYGRWSRRKRRKAQAVTEGNGAAQRKTGAPTS